MMIRVKRKEKYYNKYLIKIKNKKKEKERILK